VVSGEVLGEQNNTWIVKVLKDEYTLTYWFSVHRELLTELNYSVGVFVSHPS
jgi:hypothetical protein